MAALSRFSEEVSEEELNARIQKAAPEKTKIARKCGQKNLKGKKKNLKYQFDSFTWRIVASWCIISIGCLNKFNNIIVYQKAMFFCFFFKDFY